ncbi:MAG: exodeoxyribonuclease VII large subunit [Alphaproteobacteria bacterium]
MSDDSIVASNIPEYSVSEVSAALKRTVEGAFQRVRVRGEISGFKRAASGHLYLALKDEKAVIDGVVWRGVARGLGIAPEDGLEVICEGRLTTYPARSKYQLVIESMTVAGAGALLALLEERRKALAAEGLFDDEVKQAIPFLPEVIGVVTSPTGAVIRDILHRLADRFPRTVLLWPVVVQGDKAAAQIAAAIQGFNGLAADGAVPRPDLLIVARGGGSIEDLWAFNEEVVVRATAASAIPLISAVGHETDTTLIDFASDRRAPTPTAAAEMAVPVRAELSLGLLETAHRLARGMARLIETRRSAVDGLARGLPRPQALLGEAGQRLDDRVENLRRMMAVFLERGGARLSRAGLGLKSPRDQIARAQAALDLRAQRLGASGRAGFERAAVSVQRWTADRRLEAAFERVVADRGRRIGAAGALLESFSYRNVLARGYAVIHGADDTVVSTVAGARAARDVALEFHDGRIDARVTGAVAARPRSKKDDGSQGSLL